MISFKLFLLYMFKVKNNIILRAFNQVFSLIDQIYPTKFSDNSFKMYDFNLKLTRFAICSRGPTMWNNFLTENEKSYIAVSKNKFKEKILNFLTNSYSFKFIFYQ